MAEFKRLTLPSNAIPDISNNTHLESKQITSPGYDYFMSNLKDEAMYHFFLYFEKKAIGKCESEYIERY